MAARHFTIIGSANVDMIMKVKRLPERGETVTGGVFMRTFGGKGANQAVAAARAGADARFVACLGSDDPFTPVMMENFRRDGLDVSGVRLAGGLSSGSALVMIDERGMNYLTVAPGANAALAPAHVAALWPMVETSRMILLQMEVPVETNREVLARARAAGIPVMLNYAPAHAIHRDLLRDADTLVVNENEAAALTGVSCSGPASVEIMLRSFAESGVRRAVVTLGGEGAAFYADGVFGRASAFKVDAVDTTGAGDTFCGALGTAMLEGRPFAEAVRFAMAAAAVSVTRFGAQPSVPSRAEIDQFLQSHP